MAYSNYGAFLPTEALYTEPGAYSGVLRGEALKRASYLSEMDRFYEELEEASRQFEKQYTLAEREVVFTEEQALWEREFAEEQAEKQEGLEKARFTHEESLARISSSAQGSSAQLQYDLGLKELDIRKKVEEKQLSEREEWDIASDYLSKISAPTSTRVSVMGGQKITPIVSDNRTTEVQTLTTPKLDKFGYRIY